MPCTKQNTMLGTEWWLVHSLFLAFLPVLLLLLSSLAAVLPLFFFFFFVVGVVVSVLPFCSPSSSLLLEAGAC